MLRVFLVAAALIIVASCGDSPLEPYSPSVLRVTLADSVLIAGDSTTADVDVRDRLGSVIDTVAVVWSSDEPEVATVDSVGTVRSVAPGTTMIRASVGDLTDERSLRVLRQPLSVSIEVDEATVVVGVPYPLEPEIRDTLGNLVANRVPTWYSSDYDVAHYDNGLIYGANPGSATLTAMLEGSTDSVVVHVVERTLRLLPDSVGVLLVGDQRRLRAYRFTTASGATETSPSRWTTSDPSIASIDSEGVVTGVSAGEARITAEADGEGEGASVLIRVRPSDQLRFTDVTHGCGLVAGGEVYCWGFGPPGLTELIEQCVSIRYIDSGGRYYGWLPEPCSPVPARVQAPPFRTVAQSPWGQACGLTASGAAYCWGGDNWYGQLGNGSRGPADGVVPVLGGLAFQSISTGYSATCGVTVGGKAYCWGSDLNGQLGAGTNGGMAMEPQQVAGQVEFATLAVGGGHVCGLDPVGSAYCWGLNSSGEIGTGPNSEICGVECSTLPRPVQTDESFAQIDAGAGFTCALTASGEAWCWGSAPEGSASSRGSVLPRKVPGDHRFIDVSAGSYGLCFLAESGELYCWDGGLRFDTEPSRPYPGVLFRSIELGAIHGCGLGVDGRAYCWGYDDGRLGNGQTDITYRASNSPPTLVAGQD